ncbi:MAG: protein kinase [Vicinamibacterales bacterium]
MDAPKQLDKIGRYQVLERVGKGGMGVLYRGFDPVLDREVAIKLMLTDFTEDTEQMRPRFYREARAAAKLNHRNIVTIFEFAEESNTPYIVMEFLRGMPLGARLREQPSLSLDDKLNIVAQLCDGLSYAHEQGVVHRDVKPDNVFILEDGSVKLLDFGIAKLTSSNLTRQGDVLGSASYMSPEQVGGSDSVDGRADIFSTGVMLYELLTGHKPFEAEAPTAVILKILKDDPTPIESFTPGLPPSLVAAVMKALAKNPDDRFPKADAFSRELQLIRRSLPPGGLASELEETRYANTQMMKQIHDDLQKLREHSGGARGTSTAVGQAAQDALNAASPEPASGRSWVIPAAVAAVVLVAAGGYFAFGRSTTPPAPVESTTAAQPETSPPAEPAPPPPAPAPTASAATATPPAETRAIDTPAPARAASAPVVSVSLAGGYPFEVLDGGKVISPASAAHDLKIAAGKSIVVAAPKYLLRQSVRVEGSASRGFDWTAPGLGKLDVRSAQETCDVMIGDRKLGNPPLVIPGDRGRSVPRRHLVRWRGREEPLRDGPARPDLRRCHQMTITFPRLVIALVAALGVSAGAQQNNEEFARRQFDSGMSFLQNHRYTEALKDLQAVIDSFASSSVADNALLQIAQYQLETAHDLEAAQGAVDRLLKDYPDTDSAPMAHVLAGRIAMTRGGRLPISTPRSQASSASRVCSPATMRSPRPDSSPEKRSAPSGVMPTRSSAIDASRWNTRSRSGPRAPRSPPATASSSRSGRRRRCSSSSVRDTCSRSRPRRPTPSTSTRSPIVSTSAILASRPSPSPARNRSGEIGVPRRGRHTSSILPGN